MSRRLDPDRALSHRLTDVAERYGVELLNAHDAAADAAATADVLPHLLAAHGVTETADLAPYLDRPIPQRGLVERARRRVRRWTRRFRSPPSARPEPVVGRQ